MTSPIGMSKCLRSGLFLAVVFLGSVPMALADYTVTGKFLYEDRDLSVNGFTGAVNPRPIRFADVQIQSTSNSAVLAQGATNANGDYSITVPGSTQQQIRAVCIAASTQTPGLKIRVVYAWSVSSYSESSWTLESNVISYAGTPTQPMGTTTARFDSSPGRAFNIWDALVDSAEWVASPGVRGSYPGTLFTVGYYATSFDSYYDPTRKYAFIGSYHAQDDPVIYQRFGQFAADLYSKLDAPFTGFTLFSDENLDPRTAWSEGVGLFIGASIRKFKGYPRPDFYILTSGNLPLLSFDLESLTTYVSPLLTYPTFKTNMGAKSSLAIAAALWDITDGASSDDGSPGTDDDPLQRDFFSVWRVLIDYIFPLTVQGITVERFWDGWFSPALNTGSAAEMRTIFVGQGIEYVADNFESDNAAAQAAAITPSQLPSPAAGARVVITEISQEGGGAIELYNSGDADADLEGWFLSATRGGTTATATLPSYRLRPGEFITVVGGSGTLARDRLPFSGSGAIPWAQGQEGACALRDKTGTGRDFVRWGSSREFPPAGTNFTGTNPGTPDPGRSLGRNFAASDTDAGSDWATLVPTLGTHNLSGEEKHHTFYPAGDVDYVAFDAVAGRNYLIEALNLTNGADTVLELLYSDGATLLASSDDSSLGAGSRIVWRAPTGGRHVVRCRRYDAPTNFVQYGSYDLRILETTANFRVPVPDTVTVSKAGQGGRYNTIAEALAAAYDGDTVEIIDSGTYQENLQVPTRSLTLRGARGKSPVIDGRGKNQGTLALGGKTSRVESLTILGGTSGIYVQGGASTIVNTIVARTSEGSGADGIIVNLEGTSASIVNCTVVNNRRVGIGVFNNAKAKVVNSIAWGNASTDIGADTASTAGLTVRNSLSVRSNYTKDNGNITGDPKFVDAAADNYRLQSSSPAIDKADGTDPDLPQTDADGLGRSLPGSGTTAAPDMGAFEYLNPAILTSSAIFPQIAAGGDSPEYRTSIVGVNTGAATATARVSLTQSNGDPFTVTVVNEPEPGAAAASNPSETGPLSAKTGSSFDVAVPASGTLRLETTSSGGTSSGYAKLLSNLPLNGTALFKTLRGTTILSEAGVGLARPARSFIVYIDNKSNALSGYAVANTGTATASLSMTLRDADGAQKETKGKTLLAGQHFASFAVQDFTAAASGFEGTVEFSSDQPVTAVALRYDNTNLDAFSQVFSTIPVLIDEAATTLYFPQVADGGGYRTNFILVNPGTTPTTARLEFFDDDGKPLALPVGGQMKTSHEVPLSGRGVARFLTDGTSSGTKAGWVKVTCPVPIGGSSIFQTVGGGVITSEAGVASSPLAQRFTVYVETVGSAWSGLALCNPNGAAVDVTLKLRNSAGAQVDTYSLRLPALGHTARFFTQWFGSYSNFEGTLEVVASAPVSGVALRYDNPNLTVFATLPVILP